MRRILNEIEGSEGQKRINRLRSLKGRLDALWKLIHHTDYNLMTDAGLDRVEKIVDGLIKYFKTRQR